MAETTSSKPKTAKVGTTVDVPEGAEVHRPNGVVSRVSGGSYVLDVPGVFVVDGTEVQVK